MSFRVLATVLVGACVALCDGTALAQDWLEVPIDPENPHAFDRGPGGYLAWWKLLTVALVFLPWVKLADWMNVDCVRFSSRTRIATIWWNPIVVGSFLLGFLAVLFFPMFWVGLPIYVIAAIGPFLLYVILRNSRMPAHQTILTPGHLSRKIKGERQLVEQADDEPGPPVQFEAGGSGSQGQVNLIRARRAANFHILRSLFYDVVVSRGDMLVALRSAKGVQWRKRIDGVWHPLPAMDREIGDGAVAAIKHLADIDPNDRSANPSGEFTVRLDDGPRRCETAISLQQAGEQMRIRIVEPKKPALTLSGLGLFPENAERLQEALNSPGLILVTAVPGEGLSTSWNAILQATDRVTRDWVGIVDYDELETRVENIELNRFDSRTGQSPTELMRSILLKQPEAFVVPKIPDTATMDALTHQVLKEGRTVVTRMVAPSSAAGLLRLLQAAGKRRELIQAVTAVTGQRLARRLCDQCKQPMPANPELFKQLGVDPANAPTLYRQFTKPNPPPVDKKGRPIELKPCKHCAGLGYYGRVGLIELIVVDDPVRKALTQQPDLATITNLALNKRRQSAMYQGYRHILAGTTSTAEIQRVFKESE